MLGTSNNIQNDIFKSNNDHIFLPTMTYKNLFGFREWQRESFIRNFLRKHVKDKVTIHFLRWIWLPSDCGIMIAFNNMTMPSHILLSSHWPRKRVCEKHFNIKNQSFSTAKIGLHSIEIDETFYRLRSLRYRIINTFTRIFTYDYILLVWFHFIFVLVWYVGHNFLLLPTYEL